MLYYRVKPQYGDKTRYTWNNHRQGIPNRYLVANELYTPCEFKKLANCPSWFEKVEIQKTKTFRFFGARFEQKGV
jgi:hypothetical protein